MCLAITYDCSPPFRLLYSSLFFSFRLFFSFLSPLAFSAEQQPPSPASLPFSLRTLGRPSRNRRPLFFCFPGLTIAKPVNLGLTVRKGVPQRRRSPTTCRTATGRPPGGRRNRGLPARAGCTSFAARTRALRVDCDGEHPSLPPVGPAPPERSVLVLRAGAIQSTRLRRGMGDRLIITLKSIIS